MMCSASRRHCQRGSQGLGHAHNMLPSLCYYCSGPDVHISVVRGSILISVVTMFLRYHIFTWCHDSCPVFDEAGCGDALSNR